MHAIAIYCNNKKNKEHGRKQTKAENTDNNCFHKSRICQEAGRVSERSRTNKKGFLRVVNRLIPENRIRHKRGSLRPVTTGTYNRPFRKFRQSDGTAQ